MRDHELIVACPLARGAMGYQGIAEQDVYDVVADVERRYPVDRDRVYLTRHFDGRRRRSLAGGDAPRHVGGKCRHVPDSMPGSEEPRRPTC